MEPPSEVNSGKKRAKVFLKKVAEKFGGTEKSSYLCTRKRKECSEQEHGALAQLVEHRTENPCVPGSIPGGTTPPFIMDPAKVT